MTKVSKLSFIFALIILAITIFSPISFAVSYNRQVQAVRPSTFGRPNLLVTTRPGLTENLTDLKLKACQAREDVIKKRFAQLLKLANNMEEKFAAIEKRVEDYYTGKVLPTGKNVANYESLITNIATKKTAVQTALTKAQTDSADFSCINSDPKNQMLTFRKDMQSVKQDLKDYRTAIKNLIVAVHSITGEMNKKPKSSGSTVPSISPANTPEERNL